MSKYRVVLIIYGRLAMLPKTDGVRKVSLSTEIWEGSTGYLISSLQNT